MKNGSDGSRAAPDITVLFYVQWQNIVTESIKARPRCKPSGLRVLLKNFGYHIMRESNACRVFLAEKGGEKQVLHQVPVAVPVLFGIQFRI